MRKTISTLEPTVHNLSQAIFLVNRNAKTALDPSHLYFLKKKAIEKLLREGKAEKVGLHFSPTPGNSQQRSDVLVQVGDYYFHTPPSKEDYHTLPHLGKRDDSYRNPRPSISLKQAKDVLAHYIGDEAQKKDGNKQHPPKNHRSNPSFPEKQVKPKRRVDNQMSSLHLYLSAL